MKELLYSNDNNTRLRDIYEENFYDSTILDSFDYGLYGKTKNGDYIIRSLIYKGLKLIFVVSPFSIILVNYVPVHAEFTTTESVFFAGLKKELLKIFICPLSLEGHSFKCINTYEPFYNFCNDYCDGRLSIENNRLFWKDINQYIKYGPNKGIYDVIQSDSLSLIYKYERKKSDPSFKVYNPGIRIPKD
ncbi:hypothetical protein ACFSTA_18605 [Ornithinibacillus salinisoli]|uniref:Uncharacterized protein n=1 Tax=Ornithinibacillus salinisoli TaxID=1848459 RepID=A0ABW4W2E3_9BACI